MKTIGFFQDFGRLMKMSAKSVYFFQVLIRDVFC